MQFNNYNLLLLHGIKRTSLIIVILFSLSNSIFAQIENEDLILLATAYHKYHSTYKVSDKILKEISRIDAKELSQTKEFISEVIKPKNKIYHPKYVTKPDTSTLKSIFIIITINYNMFSDNPKPHENVIEEIDIENINYLELLATYYETIFGGLVNKHRNLNLSKINYEIDNLGFENKNEKAVFFLVTMERLGTNIWGFMNIPIPRNYKKALQEISMFPKFNGEIYYKYSDFIDFKDFRLRIDIRRPKESFKTYYLDKYYEVMKYHLMCLDKKMPRTSES